MTASVPGPAELREECATGIAAYGYFDEQEWLRDAFLAVPREHFVPRRVWWPKADDDGRYPVLDRDEQPERWLKAVYRPLTALITQVADGAVRIEDGPTASSDFTSSISCPAVVVNMLRHLAPQAGDRILEIGTGTGYSTALLCERVGAEHVVTVEIQEALAKRAEERLGALGYRPQVVCADGEQGWEPGAPYDRLLSTAGVRQVPPAWLRQVRPGGLIITPLATPMRCDVLAWLRPDGQGGGEGGLIDTVHFMKTHSQRARRPWRELGWPRWPDWSLTVTPEGSQRLHTRDR
ncbi:MULTISPECIES: methyltransferase domain-containing protein [Streptomyces]|uniref:Protein-L-isoaspartate O-methyltransferase n=3 Tax=Streptomyces TaxID=1883 RepID=A0A8A1V384_STRR1|nr:MULTISPECIES: methyltransferase domain-containing protein [Streptomyces]KOG75023.1 protein-L-isoaspartate(D-aspartate) O-methyltransferase [Kitasatospora aureofaciens]KOT41820.1 protein-L-isoaspartate(D-aspartate) O-methyltransferase [Streptomyces sp. NRRL WC-3701]KOT43976.1 protein-L-isoaspartate(D-aspartate) O-methyltransferase [Streptomyces rimosus subsp. rimosus]KOT67314.1 protein-L-isoaspartate(D-aspartate) O-methyltransferase [Streptomyces rimosus subsp. rimosus]KOT69921.1 protein-L-i